MTSGGGALPDVGKAVAPDFDRDDFQWPWFAPEQQYCQREAGIVWVRQQRRGPRLVLGLEGVDAWVGSGNDSQSSPEIGLLDHTPMVSEGVGAWICFGAFEPEVSFGGRGVGRPHEDGRLLSPALLI